MRFFKIFIRAIIYTLLLGVILILPMFLNTRENIVYIFAVFVIVVCIFIFTIKKVINRNYKIFELYAFCIIILLSLSYLEYNNLSILKSNKKNTSIYSLFKEDRTSKKVSSQYNSLFKSVKYENATIYYHPDIEPSLMLINEYLRQAKLNASKILPQVGLKPLNIKFDYDENVFKNLLPNCNEFKGAYVEGEKTIHILVKDCYSDILALSFKTADFKNTVLHEYSHYSFREFLEDNDILSDKVPAWFNEGLASFVGFEGAYETSKPNMLIPLKDLKSENQWIKASNESGGKVYVQVHYAVSKLIMLKGEGVIKELLLRTKGSDFETAFKELIGLGIEDYEKSLQEDVKNNWKNYYKGIPARKPTDTTSIEIQCFKEYIKINPNNTKALSDLDTLYKSISKQY